MMNHKIKNHMPLDQVDGAIDKLALRTGCNSREKNGLISFNLVDIEGDDSIVKGSEEDMRAYEKAQSLQRNVERWIKRFKPGDLKAEDIKAIETGIRITEKKCVIYIPGEKKEAIFAQLEKDIPLIKDAIIEDLQKSNRGKHCNRPGHTGLLFGDGSSGTLGAYLKGENTGIIYALSSCHSSTRPEVGRDIFTRAGTAGGAPLYTRLGRCVAHAYQQDPVVDACLIQVDQELVRDIDYSMYLCSDNPGYLYVEEEALDETVPQQKVFKMGAKTGFTRGKLTEYQRVIQHGPERFTGNYVTVSETGSCFAEAGDSGAVIGKAVRMVGLEGYFFPAVSIHYFGSNNESFSFPLKRALELLSFQVAEPLQLVSTKRLSQQDQE